MTKVKKTEIKTPEAVRRARTHLRPGEFIPAAHRGKDGRHIVHVHAYGVNDKPARRVGRMELDRQGRKMVRKEN